MNRLRLSHNFPGKHAVHQKLLIQKNETEKIEKTKSAHSPEDIPDYVQLEIKVDALHSLITSKALFIEDIKGLNRNGKIFIKRLLLKSLIETTSPSIIVNS